MMATSEHSNLNIPKQGWGFNTAISRMKRMVEGFPCFMVIEGFVFERGEEMTVRVDDLGNRENKLGVIFR